MKKRQSLGAVIYIVIGLLFGGLSNFLLADGVALFVVADSNAPNTAESEIIAKLEEMKFKVEIIGMNDVTDGTTDGVSLLLISATVSSGTVANNMPGLKDLAIPVINWEPFLYDTQGFQATNGGEFNTTEIEIVKSDHPLAAGLPEGLTTIATVEKAVSYGTPEGDAIIIAVNPNDQTQAVLFGYEAGAAMAVGNAPARRVGTFLLNNVADAMTAEGWALFEASVRWAMNMTDTITAVPNQQMASPSGYVLYANYPNPFNPATNIKFSIPMQSHVRLSIWNSRGEEVVTLLDESRSAGNYTVHFNASNLPSGLYFCRLNAGAQLLTQKMILMK